MKKVLIATANAKSTPEARKTPYLAHKNQWFIVEYPDFLHHACALPTACKGERRHPLAGSKKKPMAVI